MMFNVKTELYISEDRFEWMAYQMTNNDWSLEEAINGAFHEELFDLFLAQIISNDIYAELKENYLYK